MTTMICQGYPIEFKKPISRESMVLNGSDIQWQTSRSSAIEFFGGRNLSNFLALRPHLDYFIATEGNNSQYELDEDHTNRQPETIQKLSHSHPRGDQPRHWHNLIAIPR
ncbi:hypothetical protein VE00_10376 [Pseudogymnoascus sp. WSF 3629]|nr:hypothetical protein VE00_10376 [Pseudogymnoascus sp. WSF 3629]